jgi:hypothetical protein
MNDMQFRCSLVLLPVLFALSACVSTPPLEKVRTTVLCAESKCAEASVAKTEETLEQLRKLFADGLTQEFKPCEANPGDTKCQSDDLGLFVMGGPIPGRGALKGMTVMSAITAPDGKSVRLRVAMNETFIGTPIFCANADATLAISPTGQVVLEVESHYCNWALVGNLLNTLSFVFDRVDLSSRTITGYYSIGVAGTGNGKGSGYTAFSVPDNRLEGRVVAELNSLKKAQVINTLDLVNLQPTPKPAADAGRKVALVLGNAAYREVPLKNTLNDARAMEGTLKKIGFEVISVLDGNFPAMAAGIKNFLARAQDASITLVYYAGHGIEINGRNFLVATDADISSAQSVLSSSVDVTEMLASLGVVNKKTKIVILDACRDNPFPERYKRQAQGLAQIEAPIETFIAFSTSPGKVADDGEGSNSAYTRTLANKLGQPGLNLEALFRDVRKTVVEESKGRQTPWENTSLTTEVNLVPSAKPVL